MRQLNPEASARINLVQPGSMISRLILSVAWIAHIVIYLLISPPLSPFLNEVFIKLDDIWGTLRLIDEHKDTLDKAKSEYNKMKMLVDELRASEMGAAEAERFCKAFQHIHKLHC